LFGTILLGKYQPAQWALVIGVSFGYLRKWGERMANIKSAKKRISVIEKKTQRNRRVKAHLKEIIKGFESAVAAENKQEARDFLALAEKKLLQAGAKGTIHKNAASRKVSRMTQRFVGAFGQEALLLKANPPAIPTPEEKAARRAEKEAAQAAALARKKGRRHEAKAEEPAPEAEAEEAAAESDVAEEAAADAAEAPAEEAVAEAAEEAVEAPAEEEATEEAPAADDAPADEPADEAGEEAADEAPAEGGANEEKPDQQ
jgi:small subunit ribosomal protein S20